MAIITATEITRTGLFQCMQFIRCRYLLELNANSKENANPETEAVIDQWLEWDGTSLQVCYHVITG